VIAIASVANPSLYKAKGGQHAILGLYLVGVMAYWYTGGPWVLLGGGDDIVSFKPHEQKIRQFLYENDPR